jgi:hypothetical protein
LRAAYPAGRHITNLYLDRRAAAEALETSQIKRYTVPLNGKDVAGEVLFDEFAELPTIDYARDAGFDYGTAMPQAVARIGQTVFIINSYVSTCKGIRCDTGSRIGVTVENRCSFPDRVVRIV